MKEIEPQSLIPVYQELGIRANLRGRALARFAEAKGKEALSAWEEISIRRTDVHQTITVQDYREFAQRVGQLGHNVLRLGAAWSKSHDLSKKPLGEMIIFSQALNPVLTGVDRLRNEYPNSQVDLEDLIQEGIINSLVLLNKLGGRNNVPRVLANIGQTTFELGKARIDQEVSHATYGFDYFSVDDLEAGEFVTANMDSIVDPQAEVERKELRNLVHEAVDSLVTKDQRVFRKPAPKESLQPSTEPETIDDSQKVDVQEVTWELTNEPETISTLHLQIQRVKEQTLFLLKMAQERFSTAAAVIILGLIITLANTVINNTLISDVNFKVHNGSNLGLKLEWTNMGPIDPKRSAWLGDEQPLVPTQVRSRRSIDITPGGITSQIVEERLPVIRRDSQGKILGLSAYESLQVNHATSYQPSELAVKTTSFGPEGTIIFTGNSYDIRLIKGQVSAGDIMIYCWDTNWEGPYRWGASAKQEEIDEKCAEVVPVIQLYNAKGEKSGVTRIGFQKTPLTIRAISPGN